MIDLMEEYMTFRKHKYLRLDGSSKLEDRRDTVADRQMKYVFAFFSTLADGTLTGGVQTGHFRFPSQHMSRGSWYQSHRCRSVIFYDHDCYGLCSSFGSDVPGYSVSLDHKWDDR